MPVLSVIMATYNDRPTFLKTCVYSILNQTFKDFEFIIVVEPDETNIEFLKYVSFEDKRIKILTNDLRLGIAASRNKAIEASSTNYIALIDGDDFCDLNRFKEQVTFLNNNPDISVVGSNMYLIDEHDNIVAERNYPMTHEEIKHYFLITMGIANPTVMLRRKDLKQVGLFNDSFKKAEDFELWMRFLKSSKKMYNIQERLVYYRLPSKGASKRNKMHLINIYAARIKYSKFIWNFSERFPSLFLWFLISQIPGDLLDVLLKSKIINHMKNIKKWA
jgi:glycosyltransferase EpsE